MASIIVVEGESRGNYRPLGDSPAVFGRDENCDLQVLGELVSRRHLEVAPAAESSAYIAEDLQSVNGVSINNRRIQSPTLLKDGDMITIGDSTLMFTIENFLDRETALNFYQRGQVGRETIVRENS